MVYLLTYDLNNPGQSYQKLYDAIKAIPGEKIKALESVYLLDTSWTSTDISKKLLSVIDQNDRLLIVRITSDHEGWMTQPVWDWLNSSSRRY